MMDTNLVVTRGLRSAFGRLHEELRSLGFSGENLEGLLFTQIAPALREEERDPAWARRAPAMFSPRHPVPDLPAVGAPLLLLLRTFHQSQPVPRADLEKVLSAGSIGALVESGMVTEDGSELIPRVSLTEWEGLLVASEPADRIVAADAVDRPDMGTATASWFFPAGHRPRLAVDVGTGSGIQALLVRRRYGAQVHAVDLNERAVAFCKFNAALNGLDGVEATVADHLSLSDNDELAGKVDFLVWNMPQIFRVHESLTWGFPSPEVGQKVLGEIYQMLPSLLSSGGKAVLRHESRVPVASWMRRLVSSTAGFDSCQLLYVHEDDESAEAERGQIYESLKEVWDDTLATFDPTWVYGAAIICRRSDDEVPLVSCVPVSWEEAIECKVDAWQERWRSCPGWSDYRITTR